MGVEMRLATALLLLLVVPGVSPARITTAWTYQAMYEKADLVVIAKPMSTSQSEEKALLPNFSPETRVIELQTMFSVGVVLKGAKTDNLQLHHFRLVNPYQFAVAGPSLIEFEPTQPHSYLMFLSFEQDGSYSPATGQADAAVAVIKLQGSAQ